MVSVLNKLIGDTPEKAIKKFWPIARKINGLEESVQKLSDSQLRGKRREGAWANGITTSN